MTKTYTKIKTLKKHKNKSYYVCQILSKKNLIRLGRIQVHLPSRLGLSDTVLYSSSGVCECLLRVKRVNDLPPFVLRAILLVFLPHVGHAHIRVEPVDVARRDVSETQPKTSHVFDLMNVHDLLNDSLQTQNTQFTLIKIP